MTNEIQKTEKATSIFRPIRNLGEITLTDIVKSTLIVGGLSAATVASADYANASDLVDYSKHILAGFSIGAGMAFYPFSLLSLDLLAKKLL